MRPLLSGAGAAADGQRLGGCLIRGSGSPIVLIYVQPVNVAGGWRRMSEAKTLYDKIWDAHAIEREPGGTCLVAVDRQLIYEGTSPPAFQALRAEGRVVRRRAATLAMGDEMVPTRTDVPMRPGSLKLLAELRDNCAQSGIAYLGVDDPRRGIVH